MARLFTFLGLPARIVFSSPRFPDDKMVKHAVCVTPPIFRYAFPNCQALFAFGNASNHRPPSEDALVAKQINLNPGGQQPIMREGFDYERGPPQAMVFSMHHISELRGNQRISKQFSEGHWTVVGAVV